MEESTDLQIGGIEVIRYKEGKNRLQMYHRRSPKVYPCRSPTSRTSIDSRTKQIGARTLRVERPHRRSE